MERNVASRIGLTLGLILCMFLLSTSNVASHTTPQLASKPPSSVDQPISTAALQIADGGQAVNHNWRAWQQLSPQLQAKVDLRILAELRGDVLPAHVAEIASPDAIQPQTHQPLAQTRFLLYLDHQPDPTTLREVVVASQLDQRAAVMQSLLATTQREQAALRAFLAQKTQAQQATAYQPFFIVNALAVEGGLDLVIALAKRDDVARLIANYPLVPSTSASLNFAPAPANPDFAIANFFTPTALDPTNWNIELVRADRVWTELGVRGAGAVVAGFDTGVTFRHPALVGHYRGNLGNGRFDHNYNWFEPDGNLYPNGDLGPSVSQEPITCGTHGTHTLGTAVGDSGLTGTQVGMAPAATWIALPGICGTTMSGGIRDDIGGIKAFQWLLCPTDLSGNLATADCSKAPDVVNNSWGAANPTGELFRPIIRALRAANIAPVFAAGNPRALNGSIGSPGNAPEAITVGATDRNDQIAPFSGRGPSFYPNEQKPELSAPGVEVKSSVAGSSYETSSGTSMAAPHVTGLIALMVAADLQDGVRDFSIDELEAFMQLTAVDLGAPGPDPDYGYGRIDAYNAVRAVLQAGDLRGTVRSSSTMQPLPDATVIGRGSAPFTTQTNAQGVYSLTVPADIYQLQVRAWGYVTATFSNQSVVAGALAVADFALQPLPTVAIRGVVRAGNTPVADALIYVKAAPGIRSNSAVDGQYRLTLPVGVHTLVMVKNGYRRAELTVSVTVSGPTQVDIATERAPTILLVEADAYRGWFDGWPIGAIFRMALDEQAYLYEEWPIQYTNKTDQVTLPDGNVGYGLPSLATLRNYEVVIWAQSGCNTGLQGCFYANAPTPLGASATLREYMDGGGRLILSGQDLGYWEDGSTLFEDYLHTSLIADSAAAEGDSLTGSGFLTGTTLTITNASLYGYANGALQLAPDALAAETNGAVAYPILTYDNIQLPAALAIDPCDADYRAVYFGVGFENIGPRGANRDPAIAATLGGAVEWVTGSRLAADLTATVNQPIRFAEAGQQLIYQVEIANAGRNALRLVPAIAGTTWPVQLFVDEADTLHPIAEPIQLSPCQTIKVAVAVDIPTATPNDTREQWTLTLLTSDLQGIAQPQLTRVLDLTTGVFATWQGDAPLPTPRYRLGAVALSGIPGQTADAFYAIGGWYNLDLLPNLADSNAASVANERFDSCTGQWESRKPLPAPRAGAAVATVNGQIYLMGGSTHLRSVPPTLADPHANLWRYNPTSDTWQELAPVPVALAGAAAVGLGGKIYLFGGIDAEGLLSRRTYSYDIATNQWTTGTAIPGAGRAFTAAVRVGDKVALVGGYPALNAVHFYDPIVDRWQVGPPLQQGRHSMGIAVTATGALYVVGGAVGNRGVATVERLDAGAQQWRSMPMLLDDGRYGAAAAYVDGRIVTVGGSGGLGGSESLIVDGSFCNADYQSTRTVVAIGEPIVYEIQLRGDTVALPTAGFRNPLPAQLHFNGFVANEVGAAYDPKSHTITWQGKLAAGATPPPIRYRVTADPVVVQNGAHITSTVLFDSGQGLTVLRTAEVALLSTALDGSYKAVDKVRARSGETLTYTINVQGDSYISSTLTLADPLPAPLRYLPIPCAMTTGLADMTPPLERSGGRATLCAVAMPFLIWPATMSGAIRTVLVALARCPIAGSK
ncbi:MAG: S8 family serine peptidase [Caldilineaceae bacterium]